MGQGKLRVARQRLVEQLNGFLAVLARIARAAPAKQIARAQIKIVSVEMRGRMHLQAGLFARRKIDPQGGRDSFRQFALQREQIG